jgi:hypothetical protein
MHSKAKGRPKDSSENSPAATVPVRKAYSHPSEVTRMLLLLRPTLTVPRVVVSVASTVASASLTIYLTHFGVLPLGSLDFPPEVVVAVALALGIGATWLLDALRRQVARRRTRGTAASSAAPGGSGFGRGSPTAERRASHPFPS